MHLRSDVLLLAQDRLQLLGDSLLRVKVGISNL